MPAQKHTDSGPPTDRQGGGRDTNTDDARIEDPQTIAELAAWFGQPAPIPQEPSPTPTRATAATDKPKEARRQRIRKLADRRLLRRLASHIDNADTISQLPPPPALTPDSEKLARFDFAAWKLSLAGEENLYDIPDELVADLNERTPQALLRDLHRPEIDFRRTLIPTSLDVDIAGIKGSAVVRDILHTNYAFTAARLPLATELMAQELSSLRSLLHHESWAEIPHTLQTKRRPAAMFPDEEDQRWFGEVGYDPDL